MRLTTGLIHSLLQCCSSKSICEAKISHPLCSPRPKPRLIPDAVRRNDGSALQMGVSLRNRLRPHFGVTHSYGWCSCKPSDMHHSPFILNQPGPSVTITPAKASSRRMPDREICRGVHQEDSRAPNWPAL